MLQNESATLKSDQKNDHLKICKISRFTIELYDFAKIRFTSTPTLCMLNSFNGLSQCQYLPISKCIQKFDVQLCICMTTDQ